MQSAVIIAGGYSTRFGAGDKAVTEIGEKPMIRRVANRLAEVSDELVINCRVEQIPAIENALTGFDESVSFAADSKPGLGPIAGIMAGLRAATGEYAAVVACDMPHVSPTLIDYLFDRASGHDAVVPSGNGWVQATQAVYNTESMADACERTLARDERAVVTAMEKLERTIIIEEGEVRRITDLDTFTNINTSEELEQTAPEVR